MLGGLDRALTAIERLFMVLANLLLALMLVLNLGNIGSRALFGHSFVWIFPWTLALFVWMTFLAFFVIYRRGKDLTIEYFVNLLGDSGRKWARVFADVVIIAVLVVLLSQTELIIRAQQSQIELVNLPRYTLALPLFLSSFLLVLSFLADIVAALRGEPAHT
jgi:TRAP-type C4-dicarboxylate transport system permease small subunit